jgi:hypothetical protein
MDFPVLKFPRQSPLIFLAQIRLREGNVLLSETGNRLGRLGAEDRR